MFGNKMKIFLITLCFMLSVSAVNAASDAENITAVDDTETGDVDVDPPSGINNTNIVTYSKSSDTQEPIISSKDLSMYYGNGSRYEVSVYNNDGIIKYQDNAKSLVIFNINGMNYTKELVNGKASIGINLNPGNYTITTFYPYADKITTKINNIEVLSTIQANDVVKFFRNGTQYYAKFLDGSGNPLVNGNVTFNINGVFYKKQTNASGIAKLNIALLPNEYILTAIHPSGLMYGSNITVLSTVFGENIVKFFRNGTQYYAKFLDDFGNPLVNGTVTFNINGVLYEKQTDSEGIAKLNINLLPGEYILTAMHLNSEAKSNIIKVLTTISVEDISLVENKTGIFVIKTYDGAANVSVIIDGVKYIVQTNKEGIAALNLSLSKGDHAVFSKNLNSGEEAFNTIHVEEDPALIKYYSNYGISPDGKYVMSIGRPSAAGELSKYGYKFYKSVFERICPCCGSDKLYWGIFWAGSETANWGIFPVTGLKESGSAEGHIFCAKCDADFSAIDGKNHGGGSKNLKKVTSTISSSKAEAYVLKNGQMLYLAL
ncbi:Ig-like domain-containing protein [Methanobrevibacter smithii]|uniref:Ig-like domain-containing protein n=1 Tax=Methanobrevibacter smithii TaxID=2173 RepID=UPI00384C0F39